jgi:hypothetical protein
MSALLLAAGAVLAAFNLVQAYLGRQLLGPPRPPERIRRESLGAGIAMTGVAAVGLGSVVHTPAVAVVGIPLVIAGMATIALGRS